jgi:putative CocE/NonD family hydrolase
LIDFRGPLFDRLAGLGFPRATDLAVEQISIPMPDGVVLDSDRYRPADYTSGPVVLIRTPYGKKATFSVGYGLALARRGFQVLIQEVRGTFGSQGTFEAFHQEKADGLATAAWIREQDWCDGRLAMAGASYVGHTQWAVGPYLDPPLEAMCVAIAGSNFTPMFYPGGSVAAQILVKWSAGLGTQEERWAGLPHPLRTRRTAAAMRSLPLADSDLAAIGRRVPFLQEVVRHSEPGDDFWSEVEHDQGLAALTVPVSLVAGWYDFFLPQQLRDFEVLQAAGGPCRLTVGPWYHGQLSSLPAILRDQVGWLEAHLMGDVTPVLQAPVRIFLQGAGRWLDLDQWPPPSRSEPWALGVDGTLRPGGPAKASGVRRFVYDPADPTPTVGGAIMDTSGGQRDNAAIEQRADVLVYDGPVLEQDLDLIGTVQATIALRTEWEDADVFVRLCDVDQRGRSLNVCDGLLRLRPQQPRAGEDGVRHVELSLLPTAYRFVRGHRLRVQLAGGALPTFARNSQTGDDVASSTRSRPGSFEVLHGGEDGTTLLLPVFGS